MLQVAVVKYRETAALLQVKHKRKRSYKGRVGYCLLDTVLTDKNVSCACLPNTSLGIFIFAENFKMDFRLMSIIAEGSFRKYGTYVGPDEHLLNRFNPALLTIIYLSLINLI